MQLPSPATLYDRMNEAEMRRTLEQEIARQAEAIRELERRLKAAAIP